MKINDNDKLVVTESINNITKIILLSSIHLKLRVRVHVYVCCVICLYMEMYNWTKGRFQKQLHLHCKMCENIAECNENNKI